MSSLITLAKTITVTAIIRYHDGTAASLLGNNTVSMKGAILHDVVIILLWSHLIKTFDERLHKFHCYSKQSMTL